MRFFFNSSDTFHVGIAQPHLALVMENGSVWDIMSNDQFKTIEKNLLIQLPKSRNYHTFSTNNQVLNFVKDDIREPSQITFAFFGILPRTYPP